MAGEAAIPMFAGRTTTTRACRLDADDALAGVSRHRGAVKFAARLSDPERDICSKGEMRSGDAVARLVQPMRWRWAEAEPIGPHCGRVFADETDLPRLVQWAAERAGASAGKMGRPGPNFQVATGIERMLPVSRTSFRDPFWGHRLASRRPQLPRPQLE